MAFGSAVAMTDYQKWDWAARPSSDRRPDHAKPIKPATTMAVADIGIEYSSIWNPASGAFSEPSTVAVDHAGTVRAFGVEAILAKAHRGSQLVIEKPFAARRPPDPNMAEAYLRWLFDRAGFTDVDSIPVILPVHADSSPDSPLSQLVAEIGGDPIAIHRPVAGAIGLDIAANAASSHLMVELGEGGTEVAVIRGGIVVESETVHMRSVELAVAAIGRALEKAEPDTELEIREIGIHIYGWAAAEKALTLASMIPVPLASPLGSGSTVLTGARLLAESVLPWLAGPPAIS